MAKTWISEDQMSWNHISGFKLFSWNHVEMDDWLLNKRSNRDLDRLNCFLNFLRHPADLFLHMVECRPTGTFLSIIPSQSAMNLSQDEDLSTTYLFSSFLLAVLQEACLPKFHTMLGFKIDSFRIFLLSQQSQPKLKSKK